MEGKEERKKEALVYKLVEFLQKKFKLELSKEDKIMAETAVMIICDDYERIGIKSILEEIAEKKLKKSKLKKVI